MRKIKDWDAIKEASDFPAPGPGGYIAQITAVEDVEEKEYLRIEWDFVEGEFKCYNRDTYGRANFWPMTFIRSYKETALPFFKAFKTALEASNPGYHFEEENLQAMRGRLIGIVLGEEEYLARTGEVKVSVKVQQTHSISAIRQGKFKVPGRKLLKQAASSNAQSAFSDLPDDGPLPWDEPDDGKPLPF